MEKLDIIARVIGNHFWVCDSDQEAINNVTKNIGYKK